MNEKKDLNKKHFSKTNKNEKNFFFRVWGARGSTPVPGKKTSGYGGNTSCLEVNCNNRLIIFDCGTGFRELGNFLINKIPINADIFITHVHWDHIQGFPFFKPAYIKGNSFNIYGNKNLNIKKIFTQQMLAPTFPISIHNMQSNINFINLNNSGYIPINGNINITYEQLEHPNGCTAYKIVYQDHSLVYATDTEHRNGINYNLISFAKNADYLIYDAQYTEEEYIGKNGYPKIGWGHSTWVEGIKIAKLAKVKNLILWHHDPDHDDNFMKSIESNAKQEFVNSVVAYEGLKIDII